MAGIIESALRIKVPDALFSEIVHNKRNMLHDLESINLGYNARYFATLTKIDKCIKFNNEV